VPAVIISEIELYHVLSTIPHTACCCTPFSTYLAGTRTRRVSHSRLDITYMAIRLSAWLEETFESQLLLGNQWLQDKHEKKNSRIQAQLFDRQWDVFHDNGSSLDIINYLDSERNSALQVLKACDCALSLLLPPNLFAPRSLLSRLLTANIKSSPTSRLTALETSSSDPLLHRT
jgi:hypothetical protein